MVTEPRRPLLEGLTPEQCDAVTTQASPLCVIAGAGSGKTRVLTRRIAWQSREGHIAPQRTLAVTFTRRAARELRSRLRGLGLNDAVKAGTFHAAALAQLRRHAADSGRRPPRILDNAAGLISELRPRADRAAVADLVNEIGWCRARMVSPEDYAAAARAASRRPPLSRADRFAQLYADYQSAKRKRRLLDFDDVLGRALELMAVEPKHAAARRWFHQHLLVDEFQDINPLQFALLESWLGPDSTLVVVGDPDQAIYGWNGADPELISRVGERFGGCAVLHMRTNFRSTPEVLAAAGRVLDRPPQPTVRPPGDGPTVTVCDGADEAAVLARAVRQRHRPGSSWRRQAVLARTNAQLEPLRRALTRQSIPWVARGEEDLLRRPEVAAIIDSWKNEAPLADCIAQARELLDESNLNSARAPEALQAQRRFLDYAEDHLALDRDSTGRSFLMTLRQGDRPTLRSTDGIELMTFHAAKGLEWPVVHLVGLEDGFVPIAHARTAGARAEERRLLHVAVTRAQQELHVLWCDRRDMGGQTVERHPSPWLEAIAEAAGPGPGAVDHQAAITRARQELRSRRGS